MSDKEVFDFLLKKNQPIAGIDIVRNFGGNFTESDIQNSLDSLVNQSKIFVKTYNKHKIYCIKQTSTSSNDIEAIRDVTQRIIEIQEKLNNGDDLENISLDEALLEKHKLQIVIQDFEDEISSIKSKPSMEYSRQIRDEYQNLTEEFKRRKRIFMDIFEALLEDSPRSRRELLDDMNIEIDDDSSLF